MWSIAPDRVHLISDNAVSIEVIGYIGRFGNDRE